MATGGGKLRWDADMDWTDGLLARENASGGLYWPGS